MNQKYTKISNMLDCQYLNLLQNVNYYPIFIMGDHRSGTTRMRAAKQISSRSPSYAIPATANILQAELELVSKTR